MKTKLFRYKKVYIRVCRLVENTWQAFVCGNQTLTGKILISNAELLQIEDELREIRELLDN